jgi:hypothetical protein
LELKQYAVAGKVYTLTLKLSAAFRVVFASPSTFPLFIIFVPMVDGQFCRVRKCPILNSPRLGTLYASVMESNDLRHSWRHLAEKAAQEEDPKKVMELAKELIRAFDEQQSSRPRKSSDLARP